MKKVLLLVVILAAALVAWKAGVFEPAAAKAYRAHRQSVMESQGFSRDMVASRKWSIEIDDCRVSGSRAELRATERTATIPPNAASFAFATIVTTGLEATLESQGGQWVVVEEKVVSEHTSTYEDRRG